MSSNRNYWLYVLKLEDNKYYVGITSKTPEIRMREHLNGIRVAYWTAKHKPIEIIHTENLGFINIDTAKRRENKMTRALMKQRGINNVRGGDLTSTDEYIKRFGYILDKDSYGVITLALLMMAIIIYFLIDKLFS